MKLSVISLRPFAFVLSQWPYMNKLPTGLSHLLSVSERQHFDYVSVLFLLVGFDGAGMGSSPSGSGTCLPLFHIWLLRAGVGDRWGT